MSEKDISVPLGAQFFARGEDVMFLFQMDARSAIGPRFATKADADEHPEAFAKFSKEVTVVADPEPPPKRKGRVN